MSWYSQGVYNQIMSEKIFIGLFDKIIRFIRMKYIDKRGQVFVLLFLYLMEYYKRIFNNMNSKSLDYVERILLFVYFFDLDNI